jgi:TonB-linked SusC/RagA family outer membrane protein
MGKQLLTNHPWLRNIAFLVLMHLSFTTVAQNASTAKVTFYATSVPLKSVLKNIEKQTNLRFNFSNDELNTNTIVSVKYDHVPINTVLAELFSPLGFDWKLIDKNIYLSHSAKPEKESKTPPVDKVIDIIGRVTDNEGVPLPGATILLDGTKQGTTTDNAGYFRFNEIKENAVLFVSLVGYNKEVININGKQNIAVSLKKSVENLDEKVVIGYGTVSKRLNTGNTSSITGKEIAQQPVPNPLSTLQGRMPGVFVTNGQGLPGTNINIQIRGVNSLAAGKSPLYIVDGIPFSSTPLNQWNASLSNSSGYLSPFNSINPDDIERVDVLKDADATAIYGSRAANGVVLITTKKGKVGATRFDVNVYTGYEKATNVVKTLNTGEYIELKSEAFKNDGATPTAGNAPGLTVFSPNAYTNFPKLIVGNTARVTNAQANISGGNNNFRFLLGGNYRKEGTVYIGNMGYQRGGGHFSLQHNSSNNKFYLSFNSSYTFDRNNAIASATNTNLLLVPNYPLYDTLGNLNWVGGSNPIASTRQFAKNQSNTFISSTQLQYTVADGLNLKASFGYTNTTLSSLSTTPKSSLNPASFFFMNSARYGQNATSTYIVEPQATYSKSLAFGTIDVVVGGTFQSSKTTGSFIQGQNYSNDGLLQSLTAAGSISTSPAPATYYNEYKYVSGFGRVNYNYQQKYLLNLSFRRDGSSRFGPGKEFGNFGAIGAAWLFTGEDFIQNAFPKLSFGKIRASYGIVGNDQISDYQYLSTYSAQSPYQGTTSLAPSRIANPDYSWEKSKKIEAGLELGFFKDRLFFSGSWYRNRSNNQLVNYPLATQTGFSGYQANLPALIENTGVEFMLNAVIVKHENFTWNASANISTVRNKLISFPGLTGSSYSYQYEVGKPITIVKGFDYKYIDPATGIPRFATRSGKDTLSPSDPDDRMIIGNTLPDFYGGISNSFTYKGFSLDFMFQFVKQKGYIPVYWPGLQNLMPIDALNRWQKPGDVTNVPVPTAFQASNQALTAYNAWINSDRFWTDASYIRLKNVSISYNFTTAFLQKYKIQNLRLYLQGQNLLTFTKYKGSDPELPSQQYVVPTLRIMTAGFQITL